MIKKISMKGVATYIKGADVVDLAKVNFLFGNNGSGKSTLASFLKELGQNDISDDFKNCSQIGYDPKNEEILVFNDDFIEGNFVRKDTLKGVFSLNHINKDIDEKIAENEQLIGQFNDRRENELKNIQDLDTTLENTSNKAINDCFEKRSIFKTFAKIKLDNAGNKKNNFWYIQNLSENLKIDTQPDFGKLNSQYKRLYEDSLSLIQVSINEKTIADIKKEENEISNCINEIIVGKDDVQLAKLINEYGLKKWVSQGKTFLSKTKNICPFCQKETIDEDFIEQLNSIFDESSQEKIEIIKNKEKVYKNLFDTLLQNVQEVCSVFNEHNIVSNLLIKLKDGVEKNERIIQEKIDTPNEKKVLSFLIETLQTDFADINNKIRSNNDVVNSVASSLVCNFKIEVA